MQDQMTAVKVTHLQLSLDGLGREEGSQMSRLHGKWSSREERRAPKFIRVGVVDGMREIGHNLNHSHTDEENLQQCCIDN